MQLHLGSGPFDGLEDVAREMFAVVEGSDSWVVTCRRCSASWFIPRKYSEPFHIVRPFWHAFERHHQTI